MPWKISLLQQLFDIPKVKNQVEPLFIIAAPRSGTTWISKMLNAHPSIYCTENRLFGNYADFVQDDGATEPRLRVTLDKYVNSITLHTNHEDLGLSRDHLRVELTSAFIDSLWKVYRSRAKGRQIIDKITPYINTADQVKSQIKRYFPKAKIVYLVRDGRDVCTSGVFHWLKKRPANQKYSDFENQRRQYFLEHSKSTQPLSRFFTDSEIEEWAKTWAQPLEEFYINHDHNVHLIRFEQMLLNTESVLENVLKFMKLKHNSQTIEKCVKAGNFKEMSGGRQLGESKPGDHVRKGTSGDWKNYFTKQDGQLFNEIAGKYLLELGYEEDKNWFDTLPENLNSRQTILP